VKVNSSAGENASDAAFAGLAELVDGECGVGSTVLRNAGLEIGEDNLTFSSLESLNDSRVLYRRDVVDAFRAAGGRDVQGFVEAALPVNETVQVAVTVKMLGTQIIDKPQVEQLRFTQPFAQ
jgi:hypothetical protein